MKVVQGGAMRTQHKKPGLLWVWSLLLVAVFAACASDSSDSKMVAVNLSLVVDGRQAQHRSAPSKLFSWIERWFPGATPAWAQQSVTDIASIQVQITGPGIPSPATTTVPVSNPTSGQEIPVTIQAPAGANRTITVGAFNGANAKIFGGTLPGVNLTAGAPVDLVITLVRLFTVTVEKQGNGSGTIRSTPTGIDCGPACPGQSGQFEVGTEVTLSAPAASGSAFAGWAGDCSGINDCTVRGEARAIAQFIIPVATSHLHVDRGGTGTGTVTSQPSGISCGLSCDADYATGTIVRLTASPAPGSTFSNWSGGGCSGGVPTCDVVMNANQNVAAIFSVFVPPPMLTLTVQKGGLGSGTVTSAPTGIDCGNRCSAQFPQDNTVTLTATAESGSTFVGWSGACSGSALSCTVTMNTDQIVSAQFDLSAFVTLTVMNTGGGTGTVTDNPIFGVINCGSVCVAQYLRGTPVTLTATPDPGSTFNEWRGAPCNNDTTLQCVVTMDRDRTVEANFRSGG